jgi:hypothetical protein
MILYYTYLTSPDIQCTSTNKSDMSSKSSLKETTALFI